MPQRFRMVYNDKRPVHIVHPMKNRSFLYYPDARFETRTGKVFVFEVMDTEVKSQAQVVAHVLQAYFVPGVLKVFFIVKTKSDEELVEKITDIVLGKLSGETGSKIKKKVRFYHVIISKRESRSIEKVAEALGETGAFS